MLRRRIIKLSALIVCVVTVSGIAAWAYIVHANRQSAISTSILWARLAPLPPSAQHLQVHVKGSMFTREFVVTFAANIAVIQQWIAASPGPNSGTKSVSGTTTTYAITPGGGAEFAEVKVDARSGTVIIHTYWS